MIKLNCGAKMDCNSLADAGFDVIRLLPQLLWWEKFKDSLGTKDYIITEEPSYGETNIHQSENGKCPY
jgi:hypothetical protein